MRWVLLVCAFSIPVAASVPTAAQDLPGQETWRVIYLAGAKAPASLVKGVEQELHAAIEENGILIAEASQGPNPAAGIDRAEKALKLGESEFTQLKLDEALASFEEAEVLAEKVVASTEGPRIVFESRLHRARILMAQSKTDEANEILEKAAINGPGTADAKKFPPEVVSAYAAIRKTVASKKTGKLTVNVTPNNAGIAINGIRWPKDRDILLPPGDHVVTANAKGFTAAGLRVTIGEGQEAASELFLEPSESGYVRELRLAWRKGEPERAAAAADKILSSSAAVAVLGWDLRSVDGQVRAFLVPIDKGSSNAPPPTTVALPAGAVGARQAFDSAISSLLEPVVVDGGRRKSNRKVWYWTAAAIAAAALAGGGAAYVARQGPAGGDDDLTIIIER